MPINEQQFIRLLEQGITKVADNEWDKTKEMLDTFFTMATSGSATEDFYEVGGVGDIDEFTGRLEFKDVFPGFYKRVEHKEYANGIAMTRKMYKDNKYPVLTNQAAMLLNAARRTREKNGSKMLTDMFSTVYTYLVENEEGTALCSSSHTTKTGVSTSTGFDNAGTTALSKASLAATRLLMQGFKTDIGERMDLPDDLAIVIPYALLDTATEIIGTVSGYEASTTSANKKNVAYRMYDIIPYFRMDDTSTTNWAMVSKSLMKRNNIFYDRTAPETKVNLNFNTFEGETSVYMRHSCVSQGWRWILGHQV